MTKEQKVKLIVEALDYEGNITPGTVLAELEEWDSMAKLSLIVMVDEECGKKLTGAQIKEFITVQDIMDFMG